MTWKTLRQVSEQFPPYGNEKRRSPRFLAREIKAGRLRAARIGGRGESVTSDQWVQEWLEEMSRPVLVNVRRRA